MSTNLGVYRLFFRGVACSGACPGNPGAGAAGFLIIDPYEQILQKSGVALGLDYTDSRATYDALILGLEHLERLHLPDIQCLEVVSDSKLIVEQLRGRFRVYNPKFAPLLDRAKELLGSYKDVSIIFIPRKYNREADALAKEALDKWRRPHSSSK
jgi:ribonuclease HI